MKQTNLLLIMTFLFALGCGPSDTSFYRGKPTIKGHHTGGTNQQSLRIVFYDFDRTIPVIHIYHETGGAEDVSKRKDQFFVDAFGGEERIARLKRHFDQLTQRGVKCSIVSHGYSAVIKESLSRVGLIDFFEADAIFGRDSEIMRRLRGAKHKVISEEMRSRNISHNDAIFVDDDQKNIVECSNAGICKTLHVHEEGGLTVGHMAFLETGMIKR